MRISVFEKIDKTGYPLKNEYNEYVTYSIDNALEIIKNHPEKELILKARESGKKNPDKKYVDSIWEYYKSKEKREVTGKSGEFKKVKRNLYDHVKSTKIKCVTWTSTYNDRRTKANIESLSGYIYVDIDDFNVKSFEEIWNILTDDGLPFVKAVWRSFGGNGIGCLIKTVGLNITNYKSTWNSLYKLFYDQFSFKLDAQTKDITRINVLSYDPDIFIRSDENIIPYLAVEPKKVREISAVSYEITESTANQILFDLFQIFYNKEESWNREDDRLTYGFYQKYFSFANKYGVDKNTALQYLLAIRSKYSYLFKYRSIEEVEYICDKQYTAYSDQFGKIDIELPDDVSLEDQYVITAFYKEYVGDIDLKLESILNNISKKKYDADKLIYIFSFIAKETGIFKKAVISFLNSKLSTISNLEFIVNSVYDNPKYKFGLVKEFTIEAIAEKRRLFIEKERNKGNRIVDYTTKNINVPTYLQKALTDTYNNFGKINDKNAAYFSKMFFLTCLKYNIQEELAFNFFVDKLSYYHKVIRYGKFYSEDIYKFYTYRKGLNAVNEETIESLSNRYEITKRFVLPNDKKLSHLNLQFEDNTIIWANTNMGKTTYICDSLNEKRLILVPVIGALENIEERFGSSVFYGDKKNVKDGDNLIVCTYSSFHALIKRMAKWETPISQYSLYVDEMHNFAVSSEKSFRNKELNHILDNMHMFKKRVFLTGTLFPILHPKMLNFKVWRVSWAKTPEKSYSIVYYSDIYEAINKRLVKGKKNIIYLQNKQEEGEMGKLIDFLNLKGWDNIQCINADEKYSSHFKTLVTQEKIEDHVEILLCTSIMVEALNILNEDIGSLHFMSFENPILLEQMANRTRKVLPDSIYLYKKIKDNDEKEDEGDINVIEVQKELIKESENLLQYFSRPVNSLSEPYSKTIAERIKKDQLFEKNSLIRVKDFEYVVDYLAISNLSFNAETGYSYNNIEYMNKCLYEYNWKLKAIEYDTSEMLEQDKNTLNVLKEEKTDELLEDISTILEEILIDGEKNTNEKLEENKIKNLEKLSRPNYQIMLRKYIIFLCNFMEFEDAHTLTKLWVFEYDMSDRVWSKMIRQINFKLGKMKNIFDNSINNFNEFETKLIEYYHNRKYKDQKDETMLLSKRQLLGIVKKHISLHPIFNKKPDSINEDNIIEFLTQYFELIPKLDSKNLIKYKLGGLNYNLDLIIQTNRIFNFATKALEENTEFTTEQLYKIVTGFRKDLPFYKKIKLTPKNVMLLLSDCVTIEPIAMRTIYGKRVRTYTVTSLFGKYIQDINLVPQRLVSITEKHMNDLTDDEKMILKASEKDSNTYIKTEEEVPLPF